MRLGEGFSLDRLKEKVIKFLLDLNLKIGTKLLSLNAQYSRNHQNGQAVQQKTVPSDNMKERIKAVIIDDQSIVDKRWSECQKCEHLEKREKLGVEYNRCNQCGCFMKIGDQHIKTKMATAACPVGKWDKEYHFIKGTPSSKPELVTK